MRIAIAGFGTESCTFSPLPTRLDDFTIKRGVELLEARYPFLAQFDAHFIPTLSAWALPGGPVEADAYHQLKGEMLARLSAIGPLDGVYLDLHGAMNVSGMDDAEGDLVASVRAVVGADCRIAASLDLHGNISRRFVDLVDVPVAFRTAPHIDALETRERACALLVQCLREHIRPVRAWVRIPAILPGERTSTEWEPGANVYASLAEVDNTPGVLNASLLVGYAWADEPRASATAIVAGTDEAAVRREAVRVARRYWDARRQFDFGVPAGSIDECIQWAMDAPEPCVFISDSGDNPTAGGVGDVPAFIARLLAHNTPDAIVASIPDAAAVAACHQAGVGATVTLSLGGKLDPVHGAPLAITGEVERLSPGDPTGGAQVVLKAGGVRVIVTERRKPFHYIADFQRLGIEPLAHKLVVVKIGYLVPDLKRAAPRTLLALSPGAVNQDTARLPFRRVMRPIYPLDPEMAWEPPEG